MKKKKDRAIPTTRHAGINIREVRPGYYMVDYMRDLKRERQCFDSLEKAKAHCGEQASKVRREGSTVLDLKPAQREDAKKALAILDGNTTLQQAAQFWIRHNGIESGVTVSQLGDRWIVNLRKQGCRETTLTAREYQVGRFVKSLGERPVVSLTRKDIAEWLESTGSTGATWDTYRRVVTAMLNFAVKQEVVEANPALGIDPMRQDETLPTPFMVDDVRKIMHIAEKHVPIMVPTLAVQFFAGLRPGEALGLDWKAIDFKQKLLRVTPETSKVRRTRIIEMTPALIAWLIPYRGDSGPIGITTKSQLSFYLDRKRIGPARDQLGISKSDIPEDKRPKGICAAAGVDWIKDGPRKTFATMHYATHQDAGKLAAVLGHTSGADVLYRHYRGLATRTEAKRYWAKVRPAAVSGKVIEFKKAVNQ
jgi:integrase